MCDSALERKNAENNFLKFRADILFGSGFDTLCFIRILFLEILLFMGEKMGSQTPVILGTNYSNKFHDQYETRMCIKTSFLDPFVKWLYINFIYSDNVKIKHKIQKYLLNL